MENSTWLLYLLPLILFLILFYSQQTEYRRIIQRKRKKQKNGGIIVTNEMLKGLIGQQCIIQYGTGSAVTGRVLRTEENWIELEDKKAKVQMVNMDFASSITILK